MRASDAPTCRLIRPGNTTYDGKQGFSEIVEDTDDPIPDELTTNGVRSNVRGTISMAKSGPNTATSQWFLNITDNSTALDNPNNW